MKVFVQWRLLLFVLLAFAFHVLLLHTALAQDAGPFAQGNKLVRTGIVRDIEVFQSTAGDGAPTARIGIIFSVEPGWHLYWRNSGEAGIPTTIEWTVPEGWRVSELRWPAPYEFIERGGITTFGYENEVLLIADLFNPPQEPGDNEVVTIRAKADWLVCKEICVPGGREMEAQVPYSLTAPLQPSKDFALFQHYEHLVPRSMQALMSLESMRTFSVRAVLDISEKAQGGLVLKNLDRAFSRGAERHIQFFPYPHPSFEAGKGEIGEVTLDSTDAPEPIHLLRFPLQKRDGEAASGEPIRGIVVLSSQLARSANDVAFEWSIPVSATPDEPSVRMFRQLAAKVTRFFPLAFREIHHEEEAAALPPPAPSAGIGFAAALLCAFVAGFILNFMPCVLPVVSLKVMSLFDSATETRRQIRIDSLLFSSGIIATFAILASIAVSLRAAGNEIVWGFAFQHPEFVFALLFVVFLFSLTSFDLYTISLPGVQAASNATSKVRGRAAKHFFDGVLATLLSTPCTAPFLGAAIGFAITQSALTTISIFLTIGLGLSLPYLLLAARPSLVSLLPRPGDWMIRVRELMGFFLLGTALWLLFVLNSLTENGAVWALVVLFTTYFFVWLGAWLSESNLSTKVVRAYRFFGTAILIGLTIVLWEPITSGEKGADVSSEIAWMPFSETLLKEEKAKGNPVFLDFTADWCITCKFNERLTIQTAPVAAAIRSYGVTPIKADWTSGEAEITAALKRYGGQGVPFYVVLAGDRDESTVLPTLLTKTKLIEELKKVARNGRSGDKQ